MYQHSSSLATFEHKIVFLPPAKHFSPVIVFFRSNLHVGGLLLGTPKK